MDEITLADALELFKLPRTLGEWEDGHAIKVAVGRFGPYVQYGTKKYASLKKEDDPYTITPERALELIREKQEIEANRIIRDFGVDDIQVLNGRYGPYVSDRKKNGKIRRTATRRRSRSRNAARSWLRHPNAAAVGDGAARRRRRPRRKLQLRRPRRTPTRPRPGSRARRAKVAPTAKTAAAAPPKNSAAPAAEKGLGDEVGCEEDRREEDGDHEGARSEKLVVGLRTHEERPRLERVSEVCWSRRAHQRPVR
jgi:DNA topoisomerase-1